MSRWYEMQAGKEDVATAVEAADASLDIWRRTNPWERSQPS